MNNFQIEEAKILDIQSAFNKRMINAKELVMEYLGRIGKFDQGSPKVNSILEINPDALHIAEALDNEREIKGSRSYLHGIPVLVKDNIDTSDKMHTSAGSLALANSYAKKDAFIIKQLRKAGAIILGKTNMTEWANFMTDGMPSGYSSRGGQVLNPYGLNNLNPGGSSSGSGAAIACNFASVSIGTETAGSILNPSADNSIVGIKPTIGLISRSGIIPISFSQDTAGPMGRTVEDTAILLSVLAGYDLKDPITYKSTNHLRNYMHDLDKNGLKNVRLGIPRDYYYDNLSEDALKIIDNMINIMVEQGAIIIDNVSIPTARELQSADVLIHEFKVAINGYLKTIDSDLQIRTLTDLIKYNNKNSDKMLKYGQTLFLSSDATSGTLTESKYIEERIKDIRLSQTEGIDLVMNKHQLDALVFPGNSGADIAARAGYPSITLPSGYLLNGKPFGITFTAEAFSEAKLIKMAYALEQKSLKRAKPNI
ncbi:MAG: amidase family protein [Eubacteriales bacterium]